MCHAAALAVQSFLPGEVHLLESPFKKASERNAAYLLSLEPDRLLHNTLRYAGLAPKGELYGGWEAQGIAGHTLGHYLTAISLQFATTGDVRFRNRISYIINEMAECQKAYADGYIGALPPPELAMMRALKDGRVEPVSPFNFEGGAWVPWYTQHKILAGLKDAWVFGGIERAKEVTLTLADWVDDLTKNLSPDQQQQMLEVEHGGMLETLVDIFALTGEVRYLEASRRFYHRAVLDPLSERRDELNSLHANTQIPKVIGEARNFEVTGDVKSRIAAGFFWENVVHHRSYVIGGNSDREHFFPIGKMHEHLTPQTAETCNTYNMLKLTEHLFTWSPSVELADYYERALYNHILASQEPERGMLTYFVSLKPGHFKRYSSPFDSFWCCVGTGMENHTKYGRAIYFQNDDQLYVNLFIPSQLDWKNKGVVLEQKTDYPESDATQLTFLSAPAKPLTLFLRCPAWATGPLTFQLNDEPFAVASRPGQFAKILRTWKKGDRLRVTIPMGLHEEKLDADSSKVAFLYGPLVLAGELGPVPETDTFPTAQLGQPSSVRASGPRVPVLVKKTDPSSSLISSIQRLPGDGLVFKTENLGQPADVTLLPFNELFYDYYNVYWDVFSLEEWQSQQSALLADETRQKDEDARLVDEIHLGEQQSEVDHGVTSEGSQMGDFNERKWRLAEDDGYFEFAMRVEPATPQILRCTYWSDEAGNRAFDILLDGQFLATQTLEGNQPGRFFDVEYPLPNNLSAKDRRVTIRFQPHRGNIAGRVFNCAILKAR